MSWKDTSRAWIKEQITYNPKLSRDQLRRHCSKNYPFAMRRGCAYKAFLSAMREEFGDRQKTKRSQKLGQPDLFA